MKNSIKKLAVAGLFACAITTVSVGAMSWNVASAEVVTNDNISMLETASLRPENTELGIEFGLRFKTKIDKTWFDGLGEDAQVYTVLLPSKMLGTAELTASTAEVQKADIDETKKYIVGDNYFFNVVLTDIPTSFYTEDICARSYVVSGDNTYYAANTATRSVVTVANGAVELDIEHNANQYEAVEKYLVSGIEVKDTGYQVNGMDRAIKAELTYYDGVSETVKERLAAKYTFAYSVSNAENDAIIDSETGLLSISTAGTATVEVSNEVLGYRDTATVTAYLPTYGELFNFENIDTTQFEKYNSPIDLKAVDYNGKQVVSFEQHSTGTQEYAGFYAYTPTWFREKKFDTVTITIRLQDESGDTSGNWLFLGLQNWSQYNGSTNYQLSSAGDEKSFTLGDATLQSYWDGFYKVSATGEKGCAIYMKARNTVTANATFYVTDVSIGINDIESGGETVNLYDKFYTSEGNATFTFTPSGSTTATAIENPTAFLAAKSGTITATISAEGYNAGTVTANYTRKLAYGTLVDFSCPIDTSNMKLRNTAANLRSVEYKGAHAIAFDFEHTEDETTTDEYFGITITKPDWVSSFATVNVEATLLAEEGTSSTYLFYNNETSYAILDDVDNMKTISVATDNAEFGKNGVINLWWKLRQKANVVKGTIIITNITFVYKDISVASGASVSLLDTLGYTADELTNVMFTPTDGTATTVSDLTAFAPTASGTLTFTVNKEGYAPATFTANVVVS